MCGIGGIILRDGSEVARDDLFRMIDAVSHRGPDGGGSYVAPGLGLVHRRLSILDLTPAGAQPFKSADGQQVLVYNGEIYNYLEIREELKGFGWAFESRCDTEVLMKAYLQWGEDCVQRFNGMWAFALYDAAKGKLFCSRDRFGIKPFYYIDNGGIFAFGSEIRQLLELVSRPRARREAVVGFILTQIADDSEATFFEDVVRLPPGHNLSYFLDSHQFVIRAYYKVGAVPTEGLTDVVEAAESYRNLLGDSVALRLRSDVRVGTCLSGGLDSSSVAWIAAGLHRRASDEPFVAITAVSTQEQNDESGFASLVAESRGMRWVTVRPTYEEFVGAIEDVIRAQEEPFGGPSIFMQYFVMQAARECGVKVLLDGQGGDETLLGYEKYYTAYLVGLLHSNGARHALAAVRNILKNNANMSPRRLAMFLVAGLSSGARYSYYRKRHGYLREIPDKPEHLERYSKACWDVRALQNLENTSTNLPVLLRYEDKNSMAHSVEARLPFLDYLLVELAMNLPLEVKIRNGWTKWALRKGMEHALPDEIVWRRDKKGFEAPEKQWLTRHYDVMLRTVLGSEVLRALADSRKLGRYFPRLDARSRWRLYSIALWEQTFGVSL